jgi:hypothetical protein
MAGIRDREKPRNETQEEEGARPIDEQSENAGAGEHDTDLHAGIGGEGMFARGGSGADDEPQHPSTGSGGIITPAGTTGESTPDPQLPSP